MRSDSPLATAVNMESGNLNPPTTVQSINRHGGRRLSMETAQGHSRPNLPPNETSRMKPIAMLRRCCLAAIIVLAAATPGFAQVAQDQAAEMLLNSARKAFNEKNYPFAVQRFKEFLGKFAGHKLANDARYGLALAQIEGPDKNFTEARDLLQGLANAKDFPDQPFAQYYLGVAWRGLGIQELIIADAKPPEAPQRRQAAQQRFEQAIAPLTAAIAAFAKK